VTGTRPDLRQQEPGAIEASCPVPLPPGESILLGHGSGGRLTHELIRDLLVPALGGNPELSRLGDAAVVPLPGGGSLAFTIDGFVVQPPFFPDADIGELAVNGTVNDLAMMGAEPLALSCALILEEGLPVERLRAVIASMSVACQRAGVPLVTGDTKVVERGAADGLYVTTSGIGLIPEGVVIGPERCRPGDRILLTGPIASHGLAVMSRRAGISFEGDIRSDTAPLSGVASAMLAAGDVHCLRDATRGGLATVLNELAEASGVSMTITDADVPVLPAVRAGCEMLGLDPLYVANEGVAVAVVAATDTEAVLSAARSHRAGAEAVIIGQVGRGPVGVSLRTALGTTRPLIMLTGDQLPRIC
jgi:hydrogenase expression/formation protein HypE